MRIMAQSSDNLEYPFESLFSDAEDDYKIDRAARPYTDTAAESTNDDSNSTDEEWEDWEDEEMVPSDRGDVAGEAEGQHDDEDSGQESESRSKSVSPARALADGDIPMAEPNIHSSSGGTFTTSSYDRGSGSRSPLRAATKTPTTSRSGYCSWRTGKTRGTKTSAKEPDCQLIIDVLSLLQSRKSSLAEFLIEFSWGERQCMKNCTYHQRISRFRAEFFKSKQFRQLFKLWCTPPHSAKSHKSRPSGGRDVIIPEVTDLLLDVFVKELRAVYPLVRSSGTYTQDELTHLSIYDLQRAVSSSAPRLWQMLGRLAGDDGTNNNQRDPSMVNIRIFLAEDAY